MFIHCVLGGGASLFCGVVLGVVYGLMFVLVALLVILTYFLVRKTDSFTAAVSKFLVFCLECIGATFTFKLLNDILTVRTSIVESKNIRILFGLIDIPLPFDSRCI